ncbi:MAG: hypothetical protein CFH44_00420 [Proteobacteria bacterium]|nr:MAG: hypothetical protein CFH44_00420 [Pseudomonadota bacterium]
MTIKLAQEIVKDLIENKKETHFVKPVLKFDGNNIKGFVWNDIDSCDAKVMQYALQNMSNFETLNIYVFQDNKVCSLYNFIQQYSKHSNTVFNLELDPTLPFNSAIKISE